jgi:hypothetical protein
MKKSDIKLYYVTDAIFIDHELTTIAKEMWSGEEIVDTLINRKNMGWDSEVRVSKDGTLEIINSL